MTDMQGGGGYSYEETHTTSTTSQGDPGPIGPRMNYLKTIPGILKIVEIVLDMIVFICACIDFYGGGGVWVRFVSMSAFITTLIYLILYFINVMARIGVVNYIIEFVYYCVFTAFYLIAAIVAAAYGSYSAAIGACAFFAFAATAVYAVDTFFQWRAWRSGQAEMTTSAQTTTTTTHTHQSVGVVESKATY